MAQPRANIQSTSKGFSNYVQETRQMLLNPDLSPETLADQLDERLDKQCSYESLVEQFTIFWKIVLWAIRDAEGDDHGRIVRAITRLAFKPEWSIASDSTATGETPPLYNWVDSVKFMDPICSDVQVYYPVESTASERNRAAIMGSGNVTILVASVLTLTSHPLLVKTAIRALRSVCEDDLDENDYKVPLNNAFLFITISGQKMVRLPLSFDDYERGAEAGPTGPSQRAQNLQQWRLWARGMEEAAERPFLDAAAREKFLKASQRMMDMARELESDA